LAETYATLFDLARKIGTTSTGLSFHLNINHASSLSILLGPLSGSLNGGILVLFPSLGDVVGERVVGVRCTEQSLNGEQDSANLQGRRPVA
jgi:hypothetical protein